MSTQEPGSGSTPSQHTGGHAQHDETASVGHATSGAQGSTRSHETQRETGGSGGAGLTASQVDASDRSTARPAVPSRQGAGPKDEPIVRDSGARGAQDTRSRQAGPSTTGLGTPDTGANQTSADLEHKG